MVKITIKKPLLDTERTTSDEESDSEASEASESTESGANESLSVSRSGRSKRKCVLNFEKKKKSTGKGRKSRSKSVSPEEEEEEEEEEYEQYEDEKFAKQMYQCEICMKVFHSKFVMKTHAKAHKKIENDVKCDKYYHYYLNSIN